MRRLRHLIQLSTALSDRTTDMSAAVCRLATKFISGQEADYHPERIRCCPRAMPCCLTHFSLLQRAAQSAVQLFNLMDRRLFWVIDSVDLRHRMPLQSFRHSKSPPVQSLTVAPNTTIFSRISS